jgi:hypothetical protein
MGGGVMEQFLLGEPADALIRTAKKGELDVAVAVHGPDKDG